MTCLNEKTIFKFLKKPSPVILEGIIALYEENGWKEKGEKKALYLKIIKNTACFLIAVKNGKVIAMGRAISDKANDAYLQDIAVKKEFRKSGLGMKIVKKLANRLKKDKISWIALVAENDSEKFYEKLGFRKMEKTTAMRLK